MDALTEETQTAMAEALARDTIWALSGRRFGLSTTTAERYVVAACGSWAGQDNWMRPYFDNGYWAVTCGEGCCWFELANQPVQEVTEVRLQGVAITDWELGNGKLTVPGGCANCTGCPEPTIEVDYVWGLPMPLSGVAATTELACEYKKALNGENCKLPARAISITRQGVSVDMPAMTADLIGAGLTGLPLTDDFIRIVNPAHLVTRSRVYSPDLPKAYR